MVSIKYGLRTSDYGMGIKYGLRYKTWTTDHGLRTGYKTQIKV